MASFAQPQTAKGMSVMIRLTSCHIHQEQHLSQEGRMAPGGQARAQHDQVAKHTP